jgi:hypothetical protein
MAIFLRRLQNVEELSLRSAALMEGVEEWMRCALLPVLVSWAAVVEGRTSVLAAGESGRMV